MNKQNLLSGDKMPFTRNTLRKTTISVGIPAFDEEDNIRFIIEDILRQKQECFILEQVLISSDGSTDNTVKLVKSFNNPKVRVLENKKRKGVAARQNQLFTKIQSDILVLLNADIAIEDLLFLKKITQPIREGKADLVSCPLQEITPTTLLEKTLAVGMKIKHRVFESYRSGDNVYTCHGPVRAFSKRLYKQIKFISSVGEDAFSYLFCKYNSYLYQYITDTQVFYKLPSTFSDHKKQSLRFSYSQEILSNAFGYSFVKAQYYLPLKSCIESLFYYFLRQPFYTTFYILLLVVLKFETKNFDYKKDAWDIAKSSKNLAVSQLNIHEKD